MPSSPFPATARGPRRLHPPPARSPARPAGPRRPTPSRADGALGGGEEEKGATPSRVGRSTGPPRLRLLLLPHTPSRPCLPAGDLGRRRRRTDQAGDNCQLEAPLSGGGRGEGRRGKGGGHSAPPAGESGVERQRKRRRRHSRRACVLARGGPAPFRPALRRRSQVLAPLPARRPSVEAGR